MAFTRTQLLPGSDIQAELQMPSLYHLILQASGVPDPRLAAVLKLLDGENPFKPLTDKERGAQLAANARGLYEVAALCMVQPKLILDRAPTGADEIGPADLPFGDLEVVYYNFFATHVAQSLPPNLPTSLTGLRTLHQVASSYSQRPSAIAGVTDPLGAYLLDQMTLWAGLRTSDPDAAKPKATTTTRKRSTR